MVARGVYVIWNVAPWWSWCLCVGTFARVYACAGLRVHAHILVLAHRCLLIFPGYTCNKFDSFGTTSSCHICHLPTPSKHRRQTQHSSA